MKKLLLPLFVVTLLTACNNSSSDEKEEAQEIPNANMSFETTKVEIQFNFPSGGSIKNTQNFTLDDVSSYNASTSTSICEPDGSQSLLGIYILKVESNKWDVYFRLDDEILNIEGGEIGGVGQNKATIEFDDAGNFVRQIPYILSSTELKYPEKSYNIEFDFYSDLTTNFDEPFTVKNLNANGC